MHCFDARRFTQAYVDGEFDARDKGEFDAHVRDCSDCRSTARFEGWFREGLRQCVPQPPLPADLRERILVQIRDTPLPERAGAPPPQRLAWAALPAAVALVVLAVLGWTGPAADNAQVSRLTSAVDIHRRFLPVEVQGPDEQAAGRWFWGKVDFPVRPPSVRASAGLPVSFVGARLSHVGQHPAAHFMYDFGGSRVSVMAFHAPDDHLPGREVRRVGPYRVHVDRRDGYNVALYRDRDVTYAITGDVDPGQMVRFVSGTGR